MKHPFTITVLLMGWLVVFPSHAEECSVQDWLAKLKPFAFPANTQFREVQPLLVNPPDDIQAKNTENLPYLAGIDLLKENLRRRFPGRVNPTRVIYPFIGYDSGLPARLFPTATLIVGLDVKPFVPEMDIDEFTYFPMVGKAWVSLKTINSLPSLGSEIVGSLHTSLPNFRLRSLILVNTPKQPQPPIPWIQRVLQDVARLKRKPKYLMPYLGGSLSGVVSFDQGPGTPLRHYIHIHAYIIQFDPKIWWQDTLLRLQPDALIMKAAKFGFVHNATFRDTLLRHLHLTRGILVEGFQQSWSADPESGLTTIPNTQSHVFTGIPFGYENKVRASVFHGDSK